jgi:hypothetical protein
VSCILVTQRPVQINDISDTITSHEKKRYYFECLEQYVMYLHDQFSLLGVDPMPMRRVESYRGLNNRSIRVSPSTASSSSTFLH